MPVIIPTKRKMTAQREAHDAEERECALHVLVVSSETPVGIHESEFMMFLRFTENGTKITTAVEMVDSACSLAFMEKVKRWQALKLSVT